MPFILVLKTRQKRIRSGLNQGKQVLVNATGNCVWTFGKGLDYQILIYPRQDFLKIGLIVRPGWHYTGGTLYALALLVSTLKTMMDGGIKIDRAGITSFSTGFRWKELDNLSNIGISDLLFSPNFHL